MDQAPLVQMLDSTIQLISIRETNCAIHWIEIYPVDSAIHLWNNWDQANRLMFYFGVLHISKCCSTTHINFNFAAQDICWYYKAIIFNQLYKVPWTTQKRFSRKSVSDLPLVALLHFAQYLSRVWAGYHAVLWMEGQRSTCHHQSSAELSWSGKQRKLINESKFKKPCWSPKTLSLTGVGHFYHAINSCNISHWLCINP